MTGTRPSISDEDLQSFVDGELDPARRKAMLLQLAASPADAARTEAWRRQNDALRAFFANIQNEPSSPAPKLRAASEPSDVSPAHPVARFDSRAQYDGSRFDRIMAAGMGLAFAAGVASAIGAGVLAERFEVRKHFRFDGDSPASIVHRPDEPFVEGTLSAVAPIKSRPSGLGADASPAAEKLLIVPNLSDAGLKLVGMRAVSGAPICLVYLTSDRLDVTLCVDTTPIDKPTILRREADGSGPFVSWRQKGVNYSLAGTSTDADLRLLAERARAEIERFAPR